MVTKFRQELLAKRVREKRGDRSLRELEAELGISIATLSRIENGKLPDVYNLAEIFQWLGDNPADYFILDERDDSDLTVQLRAAQGMSAETAAAFIEVIRIAYAQILSHTSQSEKA